MYALFSGKKMLRSKQLLKGCCRCKVVVGHKAEEGSSFLLKNYVYCGPTSIALSKINLSSLYSYNVNHLHTSRSCSDNKIRFSTRFLDRQHVRYIHSSHVLLSEKKPSSKVEETTEAIEEKAKEVKEKAMLNSTVAGTPVAKKEVAIVKKSIGQKILDEIYHYYHGFKLLFIDIRVSSSLVWKILRGGTLTRREYNLLIRTVGDMFRLVPFSIFIIVPFMELLLPVFIKFFPGMLPSTFQTAKDVEDKQKQNLKLKLEMAKFLQKTLDEMAVTGKGHNSKDAKDFVEFFQKVRTEGGGLTSNEEIMKFSKLFEDEITLDSLTRSQLMALCRVLELQAFGPTNLLLFQLRMKLRSLAADDIRIRREGLDALSQAELQQACRERGMRALGMSEERLRAQLTQWLDLSLNEKVPPSLLLLSRAFMLPDTITTTEKLVATISALPDSVATKTKAAIGEREGKIDHKTQIELIKEEVARIQEEKREMEEEAKVETTKAVEKEKLAEILVDKAPGLKDTATVLTEIVPEKEKDLSAKDMETTLEDVLDSVGKSKKKLILEKEELDELKEEMKDYHEDVEHLKEVSKEASLEIKESKAAKRLSQTVNKMILKMDKTLSELEKKELATQEIVQTLKQQESDDLLRVDELIQAIHNLPTSPDANLLKNIVEVLGKIDADKDGVVKVDDLLKVLEMISRENVKLSQKQIDEMIQLLKKEDEAEEIDPEKIKSESQIPILDPSSEVKPKASITSQDIPLQSTSKPSVTSVVESFPLPPLSESSLPPSAIGKPPVSSTIERKADTASKPKKT